MAALPPQPPVVRPPLADVFGIVAPVDTLVEWDARSAGAGVTPYNELVQALVNREGANATMWDLPNVRSETLDALARAGAVEVSRDEFGELSFALRPGSTSVAISLVDTLHDCCAAAALPCEVEKWRVASRLDLVVELLRAGWSFGPVTEENDPRSLDTPLILAPEWIMGAKARLSALLR